MSEVHPWLSSALMARLGYMRSCLNKLKPRNTVDRLRSLSLVQSTLKSETCRVPNSCLKKKQKENPYLTHVMGYRQNINILKIWYNTTFRYMSYKVPYFPSTHTSSSQQPVTQFQGLQHHLLASVDPRHVHSELTFKWAKTHPYKINIIE